MINEIDNEDQANQHHQHNHIYHQEMCWVKLVCPRLQDFLQLARFRRVSCLVIMIGNDDDNDVCEVG